MFYQIDNQNHANAFMATSTTYRMALKDNWPNTFLRTDNEQYSVIIYDFLCMLEANPDMHRLLLTQNIFVAAKNKYRNMKREDFNVMLNLFIIMYTANVINFNRHWDQYANMVKLDEDVQTISYEGLLHVTDHLTDTMREILDIGFGLNFEPEWMEQRVIDFHKVANSPDFTQCLY